MNLGLPGKSAIVTGGSRGIGRAIALRLAEEGAGVAICARNEEALRQTEAELRASSVSVYAAVCDVGARDSLDRFLEAAHAHLGAVDILVNNPSGFVFADDEVAWESTLNVDVMAAVRASWKVAPWMGTAGGGAIIHISSIAGLEAGRFSRVIRGRESGAGQSLEVARRRAGSAEDPCQHGRARVNRICGRVVGEHQNPESGSVQHSAQDHPVSQNGNGGGGR